MLDKHNSTIVEKILECIHDNRKSTTGCRNGLLDMGININIIPMSRNAKNMLVRSKLHGLLDSDHLIEVPDYDLLINFKRVRPLENDMDIAFVQFPFAHFRCQSVHILSEQLTRLDKHAK